MRNIKTLNKTYLIVFYLLIIIFNTDKSNGQWGHTQTSVQSQSNGTTINVVNPLNGIEENMFAGLINGTVDGNATQFYSVDFAEHLQLPDSDFTDIPDSTGKICRNVIYILNNFFPYKTSYQGMLNDLNKEAAAVQIALWKFSFGIDIQTVGNLEIKQRAYEIVQDAVANSGVLYLPNTVEITMDIDPDFFIVKTTDENGNGISVDNIQLTLSYSGGGYLITNSVNTVNGSSEPVEVIGTSIGIIEAIGNFVFPQGMMFADENGDNRNLFLAKPVIGLMSVNYDWGTLPVELSSFNYFVNNSSVKLVWSTSSEINNSGFTIERFNGNNNWLNVGFVKGNGTTENQSNYEFYDKNLAPGNYKYRLKQTDFNGSFEFHYLNSDVVIGTPEKFELHQNYPNPFNPNTIINYELKSAGFVTLKIYDISGRELKTLLNGVQNAGSYNINFSAENFSAGVYFCKMEAQGFSRVIKMTLIK